MAIGELTNSSSYLPYDRYLDVDGIKLLVLPEVSSSFPLQVAKIYNSMFSISENIDASIRSSFLSSISSNQIGQRIGYSGSDYYESIGELGKWHQYSGPIDLVDFIWETKSGQIAEILEHQLHTITGLIFQNFYPSQWNYFDTGSDINLAMQQAYSVGVYKTDGMYDDVDAEGLKEILPQEFAFWLIVTAWDYMEDYFPDKENEWGLKSSLELKQQLPLAYNLYQETVLPVLSKPEKTLLDSLVFNVTTTNNDLSNDDSLNSDVLSLTVSSADESFTASVLRVKLSVDVNRTDYTVNRPDDLVDTWTITGTDIGNDTLIGFKRIEFNDGTLALDIDAGDTAGQAYRLYQAAFARTPDMPGVSYHMNDMESNGLVLENIANNFIASPEFKTKYGDSPSDDEFIDLLYQNVLGRSADDDGLAFYTNHFNEGTMTRAAALIGFAESPENVTLVAPQIEDGIWLAS